MKELILALDSFDSQAYMVQYDGVWRTGLRLRLAHIYVSFKVCNRLKLSPGPKLPGGCDELVASVYAWTN